MHAEGDDGGDATSAEQPLLRKRNNTGDALTVRAKDAFTAAGWLLRQRIPSSSHLMTPRRLWMHTVPSQDYDIVMTLPSGSEEHVLTWLLDKLKQAPELEVDVAHHVSNGSCGIYVRATHDGLLKAAEETHTSMRLKPEFGGGRKEFSRGDVDKFENISVDEFRLSSMERHMLCLHILHSLRAGPSDTVAGVKFREGQAIIPKALAGGLLLQLFPLHENEKLEALRKTWVRAFFQHQPLDNICNYFGVKIAMYFAWLGHYTAALVVPAVVGIFVWLGEWHSPQASDALFVLFALLNAAWASIWLEAWKRKSAALAYAWGTLDQRDELLTEPRPLFQGDLAPSPVTGLLEPTYPAWKRHMVRYCVSVPVVSLSLVIVFGVMWTILQLQDWWDDRIEDGGYPLFLSYGPKVLLALVISAMDEIYHRVAIWLNDLENYRDSSEYENHRITKVALFQFVNSFLSLFYIGFYIQDMEKLREQLAALLITRQVVGNLKESAFPFVLSQLRLAHLFNAFSPPSATTTPVNEANQPPSTDEAAVKEEEPKKKLSQAEVESTMSQYEGTFEDHLEMFIQFGYVVLFSSAFPMAALCALLNNLVEIRSDAFKLCCVFQRPCGQRAQNIGTWQDAMEVMGVIAVIVNCSLIGLSGQVHRLFPGMGTAYTVLLIVALEHIMLALKAAIAYAIPDVPHWVAAEMAKVEFARREAFRQASEFNIKSAARQLSEIACQTEAETADDAEDAEGEETFSEAVRTPQTPVSHHSPTTRSASATPPPMSPKVTPQTEDLPPTPSSSRSMLRRSREFLAGLTNGSSTKRRTGSTASEHESPTPSTPPHIPAPSNIPTRVTHLSMRRNIDLGPKQGVSASDPDLRTAEGDSSATPPASAEPAGRRFKFSPDQVKEAIATENKDTSVRSKAPLPSTPQGAVGGAAAPSTEEESPVMRRLKEKRGLLKRACSVSIFAMKPREMKLKEAGEREKPEQIREKRRQAKDDMAWMGRNAGGELSFIPLEKLIQLEDIDKGNSRRRANP